MVYYFEGAIHSAKPTCFTSSIIAKIIMNPKIIGYVVVICNR
jgi:hypothetical protein